MCYPNCWLFLQDTEDLGRLIRQYLWGNLTRGAIKQILAHTLKLMDLDHWPRTFLSEHCIVTEGQSIHQASEAVTESWAAGTETPRGLHMLNILTWYCVMAWIQRDAKCGLIIDSASFILLLSYSVNCHHWKGNTGVQPKDKATLWVIYFGTWISCVTTWASRDCCVTA